MAQNRIYAVCPTVERADLARQLAKSYRAAWEQHVTDLAKEAVSVIADMPPLRFLVMGDDDGTAGWCENAEFEVIRHPEVLPFAKAVNLAAKDVDCDWLLLLNNDLIIEPGFFAALDEMIAGGYEIIGAKLLYPAKGEEKPTIQHAGKVFTLDFSPFHILRYQPADHPMAQAPRPFPSVTFACVAIKKVIWDDLGGLDENYINGYEDDDFCLRARERGAQIGVHHNMLAYHLESQTSGKDTANKEVQFQRFSKEWIETGRIIWPLGVFQGWRNP